MTQSDAAFAIGKTHKVCQDYALTGDAHATIPTVWLSDGCSSSPHTDIGARLLTHVALDRVTDLATAFRAKNESQPGLLDGFIQANLTRVAVIAGEMGVRSDCLNATLMGLVSGADRNGERYLYSILYGDGALVYGLST
ncbi:MAG: protein phosphatase 2C domain-containing protein, partial [Fibrella sp.]|nr:protein phosphatase 2C domain-containing protein [Armatimonadota bacterium]